MRKHVVDDSSIPRNNEHNILGTRLEPRSDKESLKVGITNVIVLVNVYDEEEDEITYEVYELKRREKGMNIEESMITPFPTPIRSPRIHTDLVSSDTKKRQELTGLQRHYGYLFEHLRAKFMPRKSFVTFADHLHKAMADSLPTTVNKHIKEQVEKQVPEQVHNQVPILLKFMLDKKELSLTLDDFMTIFHLPQVADNNHDSFVPPPSFYDMILFYKNHLGFTMEMKTPLSFKTTGLLQPWQTLCKIFSKCLTTRVTGWDQPPLLIMKMLYCFINNIHVDYAELLCEGICYSLLHSTSLIPYLRFTKIIIEEMKQTEHYRMYAEVFGIDVPLIQSPPTESTQGTHRTPSAPSSIPRNNEHNILGTRLEPRSDKESLKVGITNVIVLVNVYDEEEDEITYEVYELKRREKGMNIEESMITPFPTPIRSPRIHTDLVSSDTKKRQELTGLQRHYGYLFEHLRAKFMPRKSFVTFADHLHKAMADSLPTTVNKHIKEQVEKQVPEQVHNQVPIL
nr:hypothetical protein [Tanacetum cinerariifolium]